MTDASLDRATLLRRAAVGASGLLPGRHPRGLRSGFDRFGPTRGGRARRCRSKAQSLDRLLLTRRRELLLRREERPRDREHRDPREDDQEAHRPRRVPHPRRELLPARLRGNGTAQRARTERGRTAEDREPAEDDRRLRCHPARQPDLERPAADDHVDIRRSFDFSRKTIHPFVTYAVSELGTTMETYRASSPARKSAGLAIAARP